MPSTVLSLPRWNSKYWKIIIAVVVFEVLFLSALSLGYDSSSDERANAHVRSDVVKVLFDFTKDEDAGNADWRIDGAYSDFADALRNEGFVVDSLGTGTGTITSADLDGYKVFIIPEPQDNFTQDEIDAIVNFVKNGGGLVYIADHQSSDRNNNGWDSWSIWNDNLNFDERFNITLESTQSGNSDNEVTDIAKVPILTDGVSSFGTWLGTTMQPSGSAKSAANQSGYSVLSYDTYGLGRVVVHCDSSTFDDGSADSDNSGDDLYDGWSQYDDATLGVNLVKWAAGVNVTGDNSTFLESHSGSSPSVAYGDGNYLVAYKNGTYVEGYFVNASTGAQGNAMQFYRYGDGVRAAYNPDGENFTVVSYDYYPTTGAPSYHKVLLGFASPTSGALGSITVSEDANKSVDVAYGNHEILIIWANLSREEVKGAFYDVLTGTLGQEFTVSSGAVPKYSVSAGFDAQSGKFLVVWSENYDIKGAFVDSSGHVTSVAFPSTPNIRESQFSVVGNGGEFMVTYRNGTFSTAQGAYFIMVNSDGTVGSPVEISSYGANYCGRVDVTANGGDFMVVFSDTRRGNPDVFVKFYDAAGIQKGDEMNVTLSSNNEETPSGEAFGGTMLIAWDHYTSSSDQKVEAKYYGSVEIPELDFLVLVPLLLVLLIGRPSRSRP